MLIEIIGRTSPTKHLIESCISFFIKELNLEQSKFKLVVFTDRGMASREGTRGAVCKIEAKTIGMTIDTALSIEKLIITLAHEMVHVKQYAKGQIKHSKNMKLKFWMGKKITSDYFDSPWEIEAYGRERLLANKIFAKLENKKRKK